MASKGVPVGRLLKSGRYRVKAESSEECKKRSAFTRYRLVAKPLLQIDEWVNLVVMTFSTAFLWHNRKRKVYL